MKVSHSQVYNSISYFNSTFYDELRFVLIQYERFQPKDDLQELQKYCKRADGLWKLKGCCIGLAALTKSTLVLEADGLAEAWQGLSNISHFSTLLMARNCPSKHCGG